MDRFYVTYIALKKSSLFGDDPKSELFFVAAFDVFPQF